MKRRPSITSPPETKKKKKPSPVNQFQSLPDDLLFSCFARVSRLYYPALSLVSKSFRSLLTSPGLYETRASLGHIENSLYVCLRFPSEPNPRWYTLGLIHDHHNLFPIPIPHSPPLHSSSLIVLGHDIYNIAGSSDKTHPSSRDVSIFDCTSHTWRKAPSMLVKRKSPSLRVTDGKIYVRGYKSSSPWMEVFDPETRTWAPVSNSSAEFLCTGYNPYRHLVLNPTVYTWNIYVMPTRRMCWQYSTYCVIEDIIYGYGDGVFKWYDPKLLTYFWYNLEGLSKIKIDKSKSSFVKLMDYGGKIVVLWDKFVSSSGCRVIQCAVIALGRRKSGNRKLYGRVEWCDSVLTVPESCEFVKALVATV